MNAKRLEVPTGITKAEQETVICWDEEEKTVVIWSASPVVLRRLHRLGLTPASESRKRTGELHGREYRLPLAEFRWSVKAKRTPRVLSEAERQRLRERLFRGRAAQKLEGGKTATAQQG